MQSGKMKIMNVSESLETRYEVSIATTLNTTAATTNTNIQKTLEILALQKELMGRINEFNRFEVTTENVLFFKLKLIFSDVSIKMTLASYWEKGIKEIFLLEKQSGSFYFYL